MALVWINGTSMTTFARNLDKILEALKFTVSKLNDGCTARKAKCPSTHRQTVDGVLPVRVNYSAQFKLSQIKKIKGFTYYLRIKGRLIN